jgi:hypothetical protein
VSLCGIPTAARAQDEEDLVAEGDANRAHDVKVVRVWRVVVHNDPRSWFGNEFATMKEARDKLNSRLTERIDEVERSCPLTEAQKKKLEVAGKGEIKRFLDRLDAVRTKYDEGTVIDSDESRNGDTVEALQIARRELFGDGSLFAKTLGKTLGEEQLIKYRTDLLTRSLFPYREAVYQAAKTLQESLGLSNDQRQRLEKRVLEETRAPHKIGRGSVYSFVIFQASRIPEAKLKPIFTEAQWQLLNQQMATWRWGNGAALFEENGYVFGGEPRDTLPVVPIPAMLRRGFTGH